MSGQITILQLPTAAALTGSEAVPIVQNGVTVQTTAGAISGAGALNYPFLTVSSTAGLTQARYLATGTGLSVTDNGAGSTLQIKMTGLANALNAASTGILVVTGSSTVSSVSLSVGSGLTIANANGVSGSPTIGLNTNLQNLSSLSGTGLMTINGSSFSQVTLLGTSGQISIANGNGVGTPTFSLATTAVTAGTYTIPSSITVDAYGRLTSAASSPTTGVGSTVVLQQSPAFTGTPTSITPGIGTTTTQIATAEFVYNVLNSGLVVNSISGGTTGLTPATATSGAVVLSGTLNVANGGTGVTTSTGSGSNVLSISPALTGIPTAPTAAATTNTTQIATTAFVYGALSVAGAPVYQGVWNASTNNPTLTSSVGTSGYYYVVSVAGTTTLNGISSWAVGDWAIFNGGVWQKQPGSASQSFTNLTTANLAVSGLTGYMYANGGSNVTASTTIPTSSLSGVLSVSSGGTGQSSFTSGYIPWGNGTGALTSGSSLTYVNQTNTIGLMLYSVNGFSTGSNAITYPTQTTSLAFELKASASNMRIQVQDGQGRSSYYWNGYTDAGGLKYIVTGEPYARYLMTVSGTTGAIHAWYGAPAGTAGTTVTETSLGQLVSGTGGFVWFSPRGIASDFYIGITGGVSIGTSFDPGAGNLKVTNALTLGTALTVANGGTGMTNIAASYIPFGSTSTSMTTSSSLTFDGNTLTSITGSSAAVALKGQGGTLGGTTGNAIYLLQLFNTNTNANYLNVFQFRNSTGANWTTATTRIQNLTDSTTQGYIDFNPVNNNNSVGIGYGGAEIIRFISGGAISFNSGASYGTSGNALICGGSSSPTWGTLGVAGGGTGVTVSTGANSVVLRDANINITTNFAFLGYSNVAAAGTTTTLVVSSTPNWIVTGSGGQTYKLPDATTLPVGATYTFNNNQTSGTIVVQNNSSTTVVTVQAGAYVNVVLQANGVAAGTWDYHANIPAGTFWSTNTLSTGAAITSTQGVTGNTLISTVATGTAPLTVASTTQVANLNAATAGTATNVTASAGAGATNYIHFSSSATGTVGINTNSALTYNYTNNAFTAGINGGAF